MGLLSKELAIIEAHNRSRPAIHFTVLRPDSRMAKETRSSNHTTP
jgi:hypothetical protein